MLMMQFVLSPRQRRAHAGRGHPRHVRPLALLNRHTPQVGARIARGGIFCCRIANKFLRLTFSWSPITRLLLHVHNLNGYLHGNIESEEKRMVWAGENNGFGCNHNLFLIIVL